MKIKSFFLVFFLLIVFLQFAHISYAQDIAADSRLADQYYKNKEFDKAEILFEKLYEKTSAKYYFNFYTSCLLEQKKFSEAERSIKKQIKKNKDDLSFYADLGFVYKKQGETEKGEKQYQEVIEKLDADQSKIINLANTFIMRNEYDRACEVYLKARYLTGNHYFNELASIYAYQRKYPEMIEQYFEMVAVRSAGADDVWARISYFITNDINNEFSEIFRTALLKRIQKDADKPVFIELLIKYYTKKNDFNSAFIQAKSLDKRRKETGKRIVELADMAKEANQLDLAAEAYQYVEAKGASFPFYFRAKFGYLNILYTKVINGEINSPEQIALLENDYEKTIAETAATNYRIETLIEYAHLQAFYLNKSDTAISKLETAISAFGLTNKAAGECRIEIGDILLLKDDVWGATLVYAQAEKDNKDNETGDKALLRKAKLAYYMHDFRWAEAQLDVLKASTSKLVANDAIELSKLIDEAFEEDSVSKTLELTASGDFFLFRGKASEALLRYDSVITQFPQNLLADNALLKKSNILINQKKYSDALLVLKQIIDNYSYDLLADDAIFQTACIYDNYLNNKEFASDFYRKILTDHANSIYSSEARKRYREIRDGTNYDNVDIKSDRHE